MTNRKIKVPEDWSIVKLRDIFERLKRRNIENNSNVLTISAQLGLINQEEFFSKSIASEDKSNYFLLHKGDFAYNKSYSNGYPFGAIKPLEKYEKGIVSPLYICFSPNTENHCPVFYKYYFESGLMNKQIHDIAQEGARNHGLLNIGIEDFYDCCVLFPPIEEQQKIASILSTQDELIELKQKLINQKKLRKKWLMQNLLTGKIRLEGFSEEWKQVRLGDICEMFSGGTPKSDEKTYYNGNIPFIRSGEISSTETELFISESGYKNSSAKMVNINDLLYALYGANSGECAISKQYGAINQAVLCIRCNNIYTYYLYSCLIYMKKSIIKKYLQGGQGNLSAAIIKGIQLKVPEIEEQTAIASILSQQDKEIELLEKDLELQKLKKKALMQLLLTGKVRTVESNIV